MDKGAFKGGNYMGGSSFFTKPLMPGYDPLRNAVFGIGKKDTNAGAAIDALPVPLPSKPITSASPEVIAAENDYARAQMLKKSIRNTIYAGDTGGYNPTAPNPAGAGGAQNYKPKY